MRLSAATACPRPYGRFASKEAPDPSLDSNVRTIERGIPLSTHRPPDVAKAAFMGLSVAQRGRTDGVRGDHAAGRHDPGEPSVKKRHRQKQRAGIDVLAQVSTAGRRLQRLADELPRHDPAGPFVLPDTREEEWCARRGSNPRPSDSKPTCTFPGDALSCNYLPGYISAEVNWLDVGAVGY